MLKTTYLTAYNRVNISSFKYKSKLWTESCFYRLYHSCLQLFVVFLYFKNCTTSPLNHTVYSSLEYLLLEMYYFYYSYK